MGLRGVRALILDNSPITRDRIASALRESGVEGESIFNLQSFGELKACLSENTIDLAFIDHSPYSAEVFDVLDFIAELDSPDLSHIVVTSISPSYDLVEELAEHGATDFLAKPINEASLKKCLDKISTEKETGLRDLLSQARKELEAGNPETANEILSKALEVNPDSAESCSLMGICQEQLQNTDAAIEYHNRSLGLDEKYSESLENLFFILYRQGDYKQAYELGTRLISEFSVPDKISCKVIHLIFILKVYDDILPIGLRLIADHELEAELIHHLGVGLSLIGKHFMEEGKEELALACFDLLVENSDIFANYMKYIFLRLMELERIKEAEMYMEFVADETELQMCSEVYELEFEKDPQAYLAGARSLLDKFPDQNLKRFLEKKIEKYGFSEEALIQV